MHIAFIAMSGVRAASEELNRAGLTMPGFVERSQAIASLPSLSLLTLAALTPDSFEISYHEIEDIRKVGEPPVCDLAAIASYSAQIKDAYLLADRYRALGVRTVLGGTHVTALADEALGHADAIVVGEGELGWPDLLADLACGKLERVYGPGGREFDLADAPMPRFDLLEIDHYNRLTVQTQRGCPWRCEFCAASIRLTDRYKVKPVAKVVAEIDGDQASLAGARSSSSPTTTRFVNRRHSKDLLRALAGEHLRWFTETDIAIADDPELLDLMHASGCAEVLIGLESPTPAGVDGVETRRNWKRSRLDDYADAIDRIQSHGIAVNGCFVLGLDGDGPGGLRRDRGVRPAERSVRRPDHGHDAIPGHAAVRTAAGRGPPARADGLGTLQLFDVNFRPLQMSPEDLQWQTVELGRRLYTEEERTARRHRFHQQRRHLLHEERTTRPEPEASVV